MNSLACGAKNSSGPPMLMPHQTLALTLQSRSVHTQIPDCSTSARMSKAAQYNCCGPVPTHTHAWRTVTTSPVWRGCVQGCGKNYTFSWHCTYGPCSTVSGLLCPSCEALSYVLRYVSIRKPLLLRKLRTAQQRHPDGLACGARLTAPASATWLPPLPYTMNNHATRSMSPFDTHRHLVHPLLRFDI